MRVKNHLVLGAVGAAFIVIAAASAVTGGRGVSRQGTFCAGSGSSATCATGATTRPIEEKLRETVSATDYTAADIGAQVNAAFTGCNNCTVVIPDGTYSFSTTINFPVNFNGTTKLICDAGATLNYTGSGYAIEALGTGQAYAAVFIDGCHVTGTSSGLAGIHLRAFNRGTIKNVKIDGFTTGDGIKNEGANTIDIDSTAISGNKNGLHNLGIVVSATNYAANAIRMIGGELTSNTGWGTWEDGALSGTVGPNIGNSYIGVVFQSNGTNGVALSGHAFVQKIDQALFQGCYFEYAVGASVPNAIKIGDGTYSARGVSIRNSWFGSQGATATIVNTNGDGTFIGGNTEAAATTNFLNQAAASVRTVIEVNSTASVATPYTGTDNGETVWWGSGTNLQNATYPGARGRQFNSISGLDRDLEIRTRNGGTYATKWTSAAAGSTIAQVDDSGIATFVGGLATQAKFIQARVVLTYSGTIATNAALGNIFSITATNGTAFTISSPTNPETGERILYVIRNTSGGAHGLITWGAAFKTAAAALTVTTAFSKSIEFVYDGTNWVETFRSAADVAN